MGVPFYTSSMFVTYLDGDKAWDLIEKKVMGQDVNLDDLYPEHFITEVTSVKYLENILPLLLPDEQYHMFEGDCNNYCITSFGRIFNANLITQSKVYFALDNIKVCVRLHKINFATEFMKLGWSFDIDAIKRRYDENKWRYNYKGNVYNVTNRNNI
jgi:hypothetical protein